MKRVTFILFSVALLFIGCNLKTDIDIDDDGSVRFVATQPDSKTKVTDDSFEANIDEIAVFAPRSGEPIDGDYTNGDLLFAQNMRYVAGANNNFIAATPENKIKYLPTSRLDFYAVYPFQSPKGKEVVLGSYKVDLGAISDQSDKANVVPYMYSNNAKDKSSWDAIVGLRFNYIFSKVNIDVKYDPAQMGLDFPLTKVEMYASSGLYRECVVDLTLVDYDKVATSVTTSSATSRNPYVFWTPEVSTDANAKNHTEGYILPNNIKVQPNSRDVIPTREPVIRLTFGEVSTTINSDGAPPTVINPRVYICRVKTADGNILYEAGKKYDYNITIDKYEKNPEAEAEPVEILIVATITPWNVMGDIPPIGTVSQ